MTTTARDELAQRLGGHTAPTASSARLDVRTDDLQVHVDGIGRLTLPVPLAQARRLCRLGRPARYGKGEQTLTDPEVRDTWEIPADMVRIDWGRQLATTLDAARRALGLPPGCKLTAEFHSMLVYERGQFFLPHQDSEKDDAMVASLVVMLPSAYSGGELVVHGDGEPLRYSGSRTEVSLVAFYADRLHEVTPVKTGHRITLTYNLLLAGDATRRTATGGDGATIAGLSLLLGEHFSTRRVHRYRPEDSDPPIRLAYLLDHQYTARSLSWSRLKGADAERAALLRTAAEGAGCEVVLALADIHETWDAYDPDEDYYRSRRRRYHDDYDDDEEEDGPGDATDYQLNELVDGEMRLIHWTDPDGRGAEAVSLRIDSDQACATTPTAQLQPYESQYEGYMGNYGNTVDRWYRRAALVVWPRELAFANRAEASPSWALDDLKVRLRAGEVEQARAEVGTLEPFWDGAVRASKGPDRLLGKALRVAAVLGDKTSAEFLLRPFWIENLRPAHMASLVGLGERHGEAWVGKRLQGWFGQHHGSVYLVGREEWLISLPDLCGALDRAPGIAVRLLAPAWTWLEAQIDGCLATHKPSQAKQRLAALGTPLAALLEAAAVAPDAALRDRVIDALGRREELIGCLVPALRVAATLPDDVRSDGGFTDLADRVATMLRERLARPVREDDDWSITQPTTCSCELCVRLDAFLLDRSALRLDWPLKQDLRQHIHARIDRAELPVTHQTRRSGRPYTLVLAKTRTLFDDEQRARVQDQKDLDGLVKDWALRS